MKFKVTFDTAIEISNAMAAQPVIVIQNPKENNGSITVTHVKLPWNAIDDRTNPSTGIWKHANARDCTVQSNVTLTAGEGLTVNGLAALDSCSGRTACSVTNCSTSSQCNDPCCHCIILFPTRQGRCVHLCPTPTPGPPARISFEVEIETGTTTTPPVLQAATYTVNQNGDVLAVHGGEIDREFVQ